MPASSSATRPSIASCARCRRETLERIAMTGIAFTNTLAGDEAASARSGRDARFVNTAMVATLLGAVSSDQLEDGRVVSGAGGQHDLVAMAHALDGARSIIGVRSTRRQDRRTVSNIVWRYANATVPRQLRDIVVTEYGIADLRGKSDRDVIVAMLGVADSAFQPGCSQAAQGAGKLESSFTLPRAAAGNRAERIEAALAPARRDGPAAGLSARHRDDRGGAGAGRPAHPSPKSAGYADLVRMLVAGLARGARHGPGARRSRSARARRRRRPCATGRCVPWCWARCGGGESAAAAKSALTAAPACRACSRMNYRHAYHAGNFADVLEARRARAGDRVPEAQGGAVPRHRYACRRRPLRARLGRGRQDRRMAGRHRAASSGPTLSRCRPTWRAACEPYLDAVRRENARRRPRASIRAAPPSRCG